MGKYAISKLASIFTILLLLISGVTSAKLLQCSQCTYWEGADPAWIDPSCASTNPGDLVTCTSANSMIIQDSGVSDLTNFEGPDSQGEFYCLNMVTILDSKEVVMRRCAQSSVPRNLHGYCEYSTMSYETAFGTIPRGAPLCYCNNRDGCLLFDEEQLSSSSGGNNIVISWTTAIGILALYLSM